MVTWTKQKFGDVVELHYGKGLSKNNRIDGTYPVFGSSGCIGFHNNFLIDGPGIIIGRKGSVGEVYFSKQNFFPIDTVYFIKNHPEKYNLKFLYFLLKILNLKRLTGDTGVPGLNRDVAYKENIILPDLPTQQKIADLLSVYDDLIENNERRIKILEETAQRLYTEWFVKFNLPAEVLTKAGFPDGKLKMIDSGTEYGIIPEGWEITKLGNKIKIRKGKNITKGTITHGVVPVIAGGLNAAYYHNKVNTKWPVVTISASGANAGFVNLHYEDVWASDCSYIDSNVTRNVYFHYLYLKNKNKEIKNLQRGAAQPHVYPKDLMTLSIIDYPEALIDNFQREVNKLFVLIGNVKNKNRVLTKIRDLLISQIITGKRALK
jgi:type I restriction enzyme S subunit